MLPDGTSDRVVCVCGAGDLIEQLQQFVDMVGWTQDMVDLITRREGYFKTVRTNQMNWQSRQKSDRQNPWPLVKLVVLCSGLPQALERFVCISLDSQHELTLNLCLWHTALGMGSKVTLYV